MPSETSFAKIKFPIAGDKVQKYPAEVAKPAAEVIDKYLQEHTLTVKGYAVSATLKSGELGILNKAGETFTLPAVATANQTIGCASFAASCKVTTSGGAFIVGDFITVASKTASITLMEGQHVVLQSDGERWWIVAGEPQRVTEYVTVTGVLSGEAVLLSASRPSFITVRCSPGKIEEIQIIGATIKKLFNATASVTSAPNVPVTLKLQAGQVMKVKTELSVAFDYSYILE